MEITCTDCGTVFVRVEPRGKLSTRCPACQHEAKKRRAADYQRELKGRMRAARSDPTCEKCGEAFSRPQGGKASKKCPTCRADARREYHNSWRREAYARKGGVSPAKRNREHLMNTYGLTPEDVVRMLEEQDGCGICHTAMSERVKGWHVDHDHVTGKVRGILCHHCNTGIGLLSDDADRLRAALAYLEQAQNA